MRTPGTAVPGQEAERTESASADGTSFVTASAGINRSRNWEEAFPVTRLMLCVSLSE